MIIQILVFLILTLQTSQSAEIDSFSLRFLDFPEGLPAISEEVNKRIKSAVDKANSISECHSLALNACLAYELLRPGIGQIEQFINSSSIVPKKNILLSQSIYQSIPEPHLLLLKLGEILFGFGNIIREGPFVIGSDKFGHFMDEGHLFYFQLNNDLSNLEAVLERSIWTEETYNGLTFGGIKSYADLVANYQGMRFWSQLVGPKFSDDRPYLKCENKKWVILRPFDFREYVDAGWDEGINCSDYKNTEFRKSVERKISYLKDPEGNGLRCPIISEECPKLAKKYGPIADKLISPRCLAIK